MTDVCTEWRALEQEVCAAYRAGAGLDTLRARFGPGYCQAKNILRLHGIAIRSGGRPPRVPAETQARMCELFEEGWSRSAIARETGWTTGAVLRSLQRGGLV